MTHRVTMRMRLSLSLASLSSPLSRQERALALLCACACWVGFGWLVGSIERHASRPCRVVHVHTMIEHPMTRRRA